MIAATAHAHRAVLLTHNLTDFLGLEDAVTVLSATSARAW